MEPILLVALTGGRSVFGIPIDLFIVGLLVAVSLALIAYGSRPSVIARYRDRGETEGDDRGCDASGPRHGAD